MLYLWLKALHLAAVLTFAGGLLMLAVAVAAVARQDRLSVNGTGWLQSVRQWDRRVTVPALLLVWVLGITLAVQGGWFTSFWLQAKLVLVVVLSGLHGSLSGTLRRAAGEAAKPIPALLAATALPVVAALAVIAILVVVKPF